MVAITWQRADGLPMPTVRRSLAQLEAMQLVEDIAQENPAQVRERFCEPSTRGVDRGMALMEWLTLDIAEQHRILAHCTTAVSYDQTDKANFLILNRARLRIHTGDKHLMAVPWHLLSVGGRSLVRAGWEIGLHNSGELQEVVLQRPLRPLLILPRYADDNTNVTKHIQSLERVLPGWCGLSRDVSLTIVQSRAELEAACSPDDGGVMPRWSFIYMYGHGSNENGAPSLHLQSGATSETLSLEVLAPLFQQVQPHFIYLNCCSVGQGGWHGAGSVLHQCAPVVLSHHCPVHNVPARARGLHVLEKALTAEQSPSEAFCRAPEFPGSKDYEWMCGVVYERYKSWKGLRRLPGVEDKKRRVWELNREPQRNAALGTARRWLLDRRLTRRGVGFLAFGRPGDCTEALSKQLKTHLDDALNQTRIHVIKPLIPAGVDSRWDDRLASASQIAPQPTSLETLRACLRDREQGGAGWLWLDFGTFHFKGEAIAELKELPFRLDRWLEECVRWSEALQHTPEIRLCFFLGLVGQEGTLRRARESLAPRLDRYENHDHFSFVGLSELADVEPNDISNLVLRLEPQRFRPQARSEFSERALQACARAGTDPPTGEYQKVIAHLNEQIQSDWSGVVAAGGQRADTLDDDLF